MREIIRPNTNFDFLSAFRYAVAASAALILIGMISLGVRGPNYGIDFAGGTLVHVRFHDTVAIGDVRSALDAISGADFTVQDFGAANEFLVRLPESDPELQKGLTQRIEQALKGRFTAGPAFEILRVESVGPRVGKELRTRAVLAVVAATLMMGVYIWFRFDVRFGIGAAVALLHDVLLTIGALSLFGYEFDLTIVAALLTIVGFSVNDTVIISDRIRENLRKNRREPLDVVINKSINETLSRTVLTTGTALLVILALYLLGGEVIHGFSFALLVGFLVGTFSSVFIASPIVLRLGGGKASRAVLGQAKANAGRS